MGSQIPVRRVQVQQRSLPRPRRKRKNLQRRKKSRKIERKNPLDLKKEASKKTVRGMEVMSEVQEKETGIPCARHRLPTHIDEARTQTMIKIQKGGRLKIQRMMMIVNGGTEVPKSPPMIGKTRKLMLAKGKGKIRAKIRENVVKMWKPSLIQIRKRGLGDVK